MQQPQKVNSLKQYQKNISAIYKQRRNICSDLIEKNKSRRLFEQSKSKNTIMPVSIIKLQKKQQILLSQQSQIKDTTRKLIKIDSFGSVISQPKLQQNNNNTSNTNLQENKKQKSLTQLPSSVVDRNRRIFGGLNSYLKKLEHIYNLKFKNKKHNMLKKSLIKQLRNKNNKHWKCKIKRQQIQNDIKALQEKKHENQLTLIKAQNQMLNFIVRSHFNAIGNFITTKAEPKVFWLPNKPLPQMQKIKANSDKYLKKKEQQLIERTNDYKQIFDYGKYLKQNQRQYYENYCQKMYHYHKNFILTKTNPEIFWRPGKMNQALESLLKESNKILSERTNYYTTQNNYFYKNKQKQEAHFEDQQVQNEHEQSDHQDQSEEK